MYLERMTATTSVPSTNQNTKLRKASSSGNISRNEGNLRIDRNSLPISKCRFSIFLGSSKNWLKSIYLDFRYKKKLGLPAIEFVKSSNGGLLIGSHSPSKTIFLLIWITQVRHVGRRMTMDFTKKKL